jgi:hypothetical protein
MTGCGGGGTPSGSDPPATHPTSTPASVAARPQETSRTTFALRGSHPSWLTLIPHTDQVAYASGGQGQPGRIWIVDTTTRTTRRVASYPAGGLTWLSASRHFLVWGSQESEQADPAQPVRWTISSLALPHGKVTTITTGRSADPPTPKVFGRTVVWQTFLGFAKKANDLWAMRLPNGRPRLLVHDIRAGQIVRNGHQYVLNVTERLNQARHTYRTDLFALRPDGTGLRRLTSQGNTDDPTLAGHTLVWRAGLRGDIVARLLPSPRIIHIARHSQGFPTAGDQFVTDLTTGSHGDTVVRITTLTGTHLLLHGPRNTDVCIPCGLTTNGHSIAWGFTRLSTTGLYEASRGVVSRIQTR